MCSFKGSSAHILKDQELNTKDIAKRCWEKTFYLVLYVRYIVGNSLPRPKKKPHFYLVPLKNVVLAEEQCIFLFGLLQFILNKNCNQLFSLLRTLVVLGVIFFLILLQCVHFKCLITNWRCFTLPFVKALQCLTSCKTKVCKSHSVSSNITSINHLQIVIIKLI